MTFPTRRVRLTLVGTAVSALVAGLLAVAPAALASPHPSIAEVEAQLQILGAKAEVASERYNAAHEVYVGLQGKLKATRARVAAQQATLDRVEASIGAFAAATYQTGGIDASLQLLLADNPTQFLAQASVLDQIATNQNTALRGTRVARLALLQAQNTLAQEEALAATQNKLMASAKVSIDANLAAVKHLLGSMQATERARLAKIEANRRAAQIAAARAAAAAAGGGSGGGIPSVSGRAGIAVRYALSKVGDRYIPGNNGPNSFDCSGLTSAAWAAAGIYIPRTSWEQAAVTTRVSLSEVQPGDLFFYFRDGYHHVAIYVGRGMIVTASNERDGVQLVSMNWWNWEFSFAGRLNLG